MFSYMNAKHLSRYVLTFLFLLQGWQVLYAQQQRITGKVSDLATGKPLQGVSVQVKTTTRAVVTDANGNFSIAAGDSGIVLEFSYIGYVTQEANGIGGTPLTIALVAADKQLDDVVVVGYGTVKKRDLTGSVVSVKGSEITKVAGTTIMESIQGKVPGVDIARTSGYAGQGAAVRVRGSRSIANPGSSNNVLYIVDGVQGVNASDINSNDVQSVEILKDASSTAIYGSRGANGVIIITTKRGTSGKAKLSFNSYAGISKVAGYGEFMNGPEYIAFRREAYRAAGKWNSIADDAVAFNPNELDAISKNQSVNWPDQLLHNGAQQDYQLGVAGGSEKTKVYFSGGYFHEKGLMRLDDFKRYNVRLNIDQSINEWLKAGIQTQLAYLNNDIRRDPFAQAARISPLGTVYNANGTLNLFPLNGTNINPLADEQPGAYAKNTKTTNTTASAYVELSPIKGLVIRSTFGAIFSSSEAGSFYGKNTIDGKGANSSSSVTNTQTRNTSWETVATYKKEIEKHAFTVTGVASNLTFNNSSSYGGGNNQPFPANLYYNIGSNVTNLFMGSGYGANKLISFTGRINYSYDGKYLLAVTGRSDGSSKLAPGHKWAFFPSVALGWRIVEEKFMKEQKLFSELKLRGSYGISGNDVVQPYATQDLLTAVNYSYNDANTVPAFTISSQIGNPLLKWEMTATKNFGIDFGVLRNRISGTIDYYDAITSDLISTYTLPASTGVGSINRNFGKTHNQGLEIGINSRNISSKNGITWNTSLTFTRNKEKIMELPNGNALSSDYRKSYIVGQSPNIFYDYKKIGIWQLGEAAEAAKFGALPGDIKVADLSGADGKPDGKITSDDRTVIGNTVPSWTAGLGNDITYKGFDLNIFVYARIGQWISSDYYAKYNRNGGDNGARVDYWTPENATNEYPRPLFGGTLLYQTTLTERKASFVKIRNITLGYTLPKSFISRAKIENIRVYVSGRNLHTFSSLKDFDPEGEGVIDRPLNRLYTAGINVTF